MSISDNGERDQHNDRNLDEYVSQHADEIDAQVNRSRRFDHDDCLDDRRPLDGTKPRADALPARPLPPILTAGQLLDTYKDLYPPVIHGVLREREVMNLISVSKIGKTWLLDSLALSVATGRDWLGRFKVQKGRVLIVDNELHKPTAAFRIKTVADALGISRKEYESTLEIWPIRGEGLDIFQIGMQLESLDRKFVLIGIDAKYRALPQGTKEGDNADETKLYNEVVRLTETMSSAFALVHHSSKGEQGDRRVTDVGSGAGAMSRAADTHLILREHENPDAAVLDAAVRSFAPIQPIAVRWDFPLWVPDSSLDVTKIRGKKPDKQKQQDAENMETDNDILAACETWETRHAIRVATGFGDSRRDKGIARLLKLDLLNKDKQTRGGKKVSVFRRSIHAAQPTQNYTPTEEQDWE
jgi:hypothetical protein